MLSFLWVCHYSLGCKELNQKQVLGGGKNWERQWWQGKVGFSQYHKPIAEQQWDGECPGECLAGENPDLELGQERRPKAERHWSTKETRWRVCASVCVCKGNCQHHLGETPIIKGDLELKVRAAQLKPTGNGEMYAWASLSSSHLPLFTSLQRNKQYFISVNLCLDDLTVNPLPSFLTYLGQVLAGHLCPVCSWGGEVESVVGGSSSIPKAGTRAPEPFPAGPHHMPPAGAGTRAAGSGQTIKAKRDVICSWHQPDSPQTEAAGCPKELRLLDQQTW